MVHFPWKKAGPEPVGKPTNFISLPLTGIVNLPSIQMTKGNMLGYPLLGHELFSFFALKVVPGNINFVPVL